MSTIDHFILYGAALVTSTFSGAIGMGGGIMLLAVMAQYFSLEVLIPLHGLIQFASNFSRTLINVKDVVWSLVGPFAIGTVLGVCVGSQMVFDVPEHIYKVVLGCFILFITFKPKFKFEREVPYKFFWLGGFASFLSLFVGATGPLLAPFFLKEKLTKEALVSTKAACQVCVHTVKVTTFFILGFLVGPYLDFLGVMVLLVALGSWLGKLLLGKISDRAFRIVFKVIIALLATRMIVFALI